MICGDGGIFRMDRIVAQCELANYEDRSNAQHMSFCTVCVVFGVFFVIISIISNGDYMQRSIGDVFDVATTSTSIDAYGFK